MITMLQKFALIIFTFFCSTNLFAHTRIVKDQKQLDSVLKITAPGDIIILKNGEWPNTNIKIQVDGTKESPITVKAETAGKVMLTGVSSLQIGADHIVVDGLNFMNGYSKQNGVIIFRYGKKVANYCRVTNTVINSFNKPGRRDDEYWITIYGKHNRLDHNSFAYKKTFGVLLAVVMDDERSRESYHSIDHNYFGPRPPLGSNSGETIRVGVSQHLQFNSYTQIVDNIFDRCDGETEIISIKSCGNAIRNNIFKQCQGAVVLRHGNRNAVEGNIFLGLKKTGTGGVRIINADQIVANNLFYQCVGEDFRSPLVIMNGVPNGPANRYEPVNRAIVANNTFVECTSFSIGEGSDTERSQAPRNIYFFRNAFYNQKDSAIYLAYDNTDSVYFYQNAFNNFAGKKPLGFASRNMPVEKLGGYTFPTIKETTANAGLPGNISSLLKLLSAPLPASIGASSLSYFQKVLANEKNCGASYARNEVQLRGKEMATVTIACANGAELEKVFGMQSKTPINIKLTGKSYELTKPIDIAGKVMITQVNRSPVSFNSDNDLDALFLVKGGGSLHLERITFELEKMKAGHFILMDTAGGANHAVIQINQCSFENQQRINDKSSFIFAPRSSFADSIVITNNSFANNSVDFFVNNMELENKGIYNAERIRITDNKFVGQNGQLVNMYRGGNDESTLGPNLIFAKNLVKDCTSEKSLFELTGVQQTNISANIFTNANMGHDFITYKDWVRAWHTLQSNIFKNTGEIKENKFVTTKNNLIQ